MDNEKTKFIPLLIIKFYQKFLTIFSFGSCRYHPTCSEYAVWQFENNNILLAFYYSFIRILKCNQLFDGGFDYPKVEYKFKKFSFIKKSDKHNKKFNVKYWYIPKTTSSFPQAEKNNYIIIKNWKYKNVNKR